jgi:hypothetical protein
MRGMPGGVQRRGGQAQRYSAGGVRGANTAGGVGLIEGGLSLIGEIFRQRLVGVDWALGVVEGGVHTRIVA